MVSRNLALKTHLSSVIRIISEELQILRKLVMHQFSIRPPERLDSGTYVVSISALFFSLLPIMLYFFLFHERAGGEESERVSHY